MGCWVLWVCVWGVVVVVVLVCLFLFVWGCVVLPPFGRGEAGPSVDFEGRAEMVSTPKAGVETISHASS